MASKIYACKKSFINKKMSNIRYRRKTKIKILFTFFTKFVKFVFSSKFNTNSPNSRNIMKPLFWPTKTRLRVKLWAFFLLLLLRSHFCILQPALLSQSMYNSLVIFWGLLEYKIQYYIKVTHYEDFMF